MRRFRTTQGSAPRVAASVAARPGHILRLIRELHARLIRSTIAATSSAGISAWAP